MAQLNHSPSALHNQQQSRTAPRPLPYELLNELLICLPRQQFCRFSALLSSSSVVYDLLSRNESFRQWRLRLLQERNRLMELAKLCKKWQKYDMMAQTMKKLVDLGMELSDEGCNLFSEAYAGLILVRQKEWDELSEFEKQAEGLANQFAMEQQAEGLENHLAMEQQAEELANQLATEQQAEGLANQLATEHREKAIKRREKSEAKFRDIAHELLVILENVLLPRARAVGTKLLWLKLKAVCHEHLAKFGTTDVNRDELLATARQSYEDVYQLAKDHMEVTHSFRIDLTLNFARFCYNFLNQRKEARQMVKQAKEEAEAQINPLLQQLGACLDEWESDSDEEGEQSSMEAD